MKSKFGDFDSFKYELKGFTYHLYFNGLNWRCAISGIMYSLTDYDFTSQELAKNYAESIINGALWHL